MPISPDHSTPSADDYRAKAAALATVISGATEQEWSGASPCEGWSAADVLDHIVSTQRDFLTGHDFDPEPGDGEAGADLAETWSRHAAHVAGLLDDPQVAHHQYDGYFGPTTTGETIAQFYGWDMLVHRWDIAQAMGRDAHLSETELDEIGMGLEGFGEALYSPGICAPALEVDADAPKLVRVMALLGRDAGHTGDRRM